MLAVRRLSLRAAHGMWLTAAALSCALWSADEARAAEPAGVARIDGSVGGAGGRGATGPHRTPRIKRPRAGITQAGSSSCLDGADLHKLSGTIYEEQDGGWYFTQPSGTVVPSPVGVINDWGDGQVTNHQNEYAFSHVYKQAGRYTVIVYVAGITTAITGVAHECRDAFSYVVTVIPDPDRPVAKLLVSVTQGGRVIYNTKGSRPGNASRTIKSYEISFGAGGPPYVAVPPEGSYQFPLPLAGPPVSPPGAKQTYTIGLRVTDNTGAVSKLVEQTVDLCRPSSGGALNGGHYVWLVRCVELGLPSQSPREIMSTMRQFYYSGRSWSLRPPESLWNAVIPCGLPVPDPTVTLNRQLIRALGQSEGTFTTTAAGHIWTGLESMECPSQSVRVPMFMGSVPVPMANYNWATWGGDVGSAAAMKTYADGGYGPAREWRDLFGPTGTHASDQDLSGDLDGLALHYAAAGDPTCSSAPGPLVHVLPMSELLRRYFYGRATVYPDYPADFRKFRGDCVRRLLGKPPARPSPLPPPPGAAPAPGVTSPFPAYWVLPAKYNDEVFTFASGFYSRRPGIRGLDVFLARGRLRSNSAEANRVFARWLVTQP